MNQCRVLRVATWIAFWCCTTCAVGAIGGCRGTTTAPSRVAHHVLDRSPGEWMVRTELLFGLGRKGQPDVTDGQWRAFVDEVVTPRFPDGMTIVDGRGQWRGDDGVRREEPSRVMIIVHAPRKDACRSLEQIRLIYRERFGQESVLRIDSVARVAF